MAIPFAMPSDNEAEAQGQQLEQLMLDLYAALQQVLRSRNAQQHPSRNHRVPRQAGEAYLREHPVILVNSNLSRVPLPDLVLSAVEEYPLETYHVTVSAPNSPTRDAAFQFPECSNEAPPVPMPRPRRRKLPSESGGAVASKMPMKESTCKSCSSYFGQSFNERQWANMGTNLRNIADEFHASKTKATEIEKPRLTALNANFVNNGNAGGSTDSLLSLLLQVPLRDTLWTTFALYVGWRLVSCLR